MPLLLQLRQIFSSLSGTWGPRALLGLSCALGVSGMAFFLNSSSSIETTETAPVTILNTPELIPVPEPKNAPQIILASAELPAPPLEVYVPAPTTEPLPPRIPFVGVSEPQRLAQQTDLDAVPAYEQYEPAPTATVKPDVPLESPPVLALPANQPDTDPVPLEVTPKVENDREALRFRFREAPWDTVLADFAERAGLTLQMSKVPSGVVNIDSNELYDINNAIDLLNSYLVQQQFLLLRSGRFLNVMDATRPIPTNLIPRVQHFEIAERGRFEYFSVILPVPTGHAGQMALELQELLSPMGKLLPLANSNHLYVADLGESIRRISDLLSLDEVDYRRMAYRVVPLKNVEAEEVAKSIREIVQGSVSVTSDGGDIQQVSAVTVASVSQGRVVAEKSTNSLIIHGDHKYVAEMEALALELDLPPQEVLIQALLVEVELGNTKETGVELGLQDSVLFDRSVIDSILTITESLTNPGTGIVTTNERIISQTATPGFNFNNAPLGNNIAASPSRVGSQALGSFGVGRVNGDLGYGGLVLSAGSESISVLIRALAANHHLDILSRPQIRTVDDHEATIQIGQQVPVVDGVSVNAVGSANPVIRQEQAGIIMKVTPHIGLDNTVTITTKAEKSQFNTAPGSGVVIFTDATNGNVIEAPIKNLTTADTTVTIRDGETIVIGGMITEEVVTNERKVPYIGDIPIVGKAFRYDLHDSVRKELLIFLSPRIINSHEKEEEINRTEMDRMAFPYAAAQQMHGRPAHPWPNTSGPMMQGIDTEEIVVDDVQFMDLDTTPSEPLQSEQFIPPEPVSSP